MRAKNSELAEMIRERDRARHELDKLKSVSVYLSFMIFSYIYICIFIYLVY